MSRLKAAAPGGGMRVGGEKLVLEKLRHARKRGDKIGKTGAVGVGRAGIGR